MEHQVFTAGNKGATVRSDCFVTLETNQTSNQIILDSKVEVMYGDAIRKLAGDILNFYGIKRVKLTIEDSGALDFTLAARIEAVVKMAFPTEEEYLLPMNEANIYSTQKERFRFSRLYLPGNSPAMMLNAGLHKPNAIILDLEDSVAHDKKFETRFHVRNALRAVDFYGAERMVRINQLPMGLADLRSVVPHNVNLVLLPKCETSMQIRLVELEIMNLKEKHKFEYPVYIMPIIESALGVENVFEIARSSKYIVAIAIGLEDFTADLGVQRTQQGSESFYARTRIINACKALGIQPIDSVFSDVADEDGLRAAVKAAKALGFEGMGCIHPRQIAPIHESFAPDKIEIEKAQKIVIAFEEAKTKGLGVVSLGTKMIDAPVVKRAEKTLKLALQLGLIADNWKNTEA